MPPAAPVLVESPTYPNALAALAARRARIFTHGVGEYGLGRRAAARHAAADPAAAGVPDPGVPEPDRAPDAGRLRERLVGAAQAAGTDLVVDESFVDLALDGTPMPPPVAVFDRHSRVISIGGMSKPYWGGLRIGWVRASAPLVQRLAAARVGVDMASPVLDQFVAVRLLARADGDRAGPARPARRPAGRAGRGAARAPAGVALRRAGRRRDAVGGAGRADLQRAVPGRRGVGRTAGARPPLRAGRHAGALPAPAVHAARADLVEAVQRIAAVRYDLDRAGRPQWANPAVIA